MRSMPTVAASSASTEPSSRTFTTQSAAVTFRSAARSRQTQRDAMDDYTPETAPGGAITSSPRQQAVVIAASASPSPPRMEGGRVPLRESLRGLLDAVLDRLDAAADRIADAAGLR